MVDNPDPDTDARMLGNTGTNRFKWYEWCRELGTVDTGTEMVLIRQVVDSPDPDTDMKIAR